MKVAIIGAGPRGLYAAGVLIDVAARDGVRLDVDVWDPKPMGEGDRKSGWAALVPRVSGGGCLAHVCVHPAAISRSKAGWLVDGFGYDAVLSSDADPALSEPALERWAHAVLQRC